MLCSTRIKHIITVMCVVSCITGFLWLLLFFGGGGAWLDLRPLAAVMLAFSMVAAIATALYGLATTRRLLLLSGFLFAVVSTAAFYWVAGSLSALLSSMNPLAFGGLFVAVSFTLACISSFARAHELRIDQGW